MSKALGNSLVFLKQIDKQLSSIGEDHIKQNDLAKNSSINSNNNNVGIIKRSKYSLTDDQKMKQYQQDVRRLEQDISDMFQRAREISYNQY